MNVRRPCPQACGIVVMMKTREAVDEIMSKHMQDSHSDAARAAMEAATVEFVASWDGTLGPVPTYPERAAQV